MLKKSLVNPRRSSVHRQSSISLFRALLIGCRASDLAAQAKADFENVVFNRFRANQHVTSKRILADAFTAGFEVRIRYSSSGHCLHLLGATASRDWRLRPHS